MLQSSMDLPKNIPTRFHKAIEQILRLQKDNRYVAAFIFGSVVRGEATENSDFDVKVITDTGNPCSNINHPFINNIKLDITFNSIKQIKEATDKEISKGERIPMVAESIIIFDKTGELTQLQKEAQKAERKDITKDDEQLIQFMVYHADDKAKRFIETDPFSSLLSMHIGINDLLKIHYQIRKKWWVSNKRLLPDMRQWDPTLAKLIEQFLNTQEVKQKYLIWTDIIEHILKSIGGRQPISENNCNCEVCIQDLAYLLQD